jgi:hypothetical protein
MRLRKLTDKAKNVDAQAGGGIQSFFNQRMIDANERTAANASTSAVTTPAAIIEAAGTNTKAAGTNTKQLACSSLQLHSFSDDEDADGEHPACKHRRTTMSGAQPPAPELHTRDNDNDELPWVAEDSDEDNSLYDNDGEGGDMQDESGEDDWGAEEEDIMVSYHESSTANSLTFIQAVPPSSRSASMASICFHATTADDRDEDNDNAASNSSSNEDVYARMQRNIAYE